MRGLVIGVALVLGACKGGTAVEYEDKDSDGFAEDVDCDDLNAAVNPEAAERCDGVDNDCNGEVDDGDPEDAAEWFADADGDGFGDVDDSVRSCTPVAGHVDNDTDCDDDDPRYHPGAPEEDCSDPNDYNCDGSIGYEDADKDGVPACEDCDDGAREVNPGADELCNDQDDDCDGDIDEDDAIDAPEWFGDADGDGFGGSQFVTQACDKPDGYVDNQTDCDDLDPTTYPDATELCDEADNNCDGEVDEGVTDTWYRDADSDGFGDADRTTEACAAPRGYVANAEDCDDDAASTNPAALELCDEDDNDCDGDVDEDDAIDAPTWYADTDKDTYGDVRTTARACAAPSGFVSDNTDCDDARVAVHPGATELCNTLDDDCDGATDEDDAKDAPSWYLDGDGDGYGWAGTSRRACATPRGYVGNALDCDDTRSSVRPGATETCNGRDDDCDKVTDEADSIDAKTWYRDFDGDLYGDVKTTTRACNKPTGYVSDRDDCDDRAKAINPSATEVCDEADNDCDGTIDNPEDVIGTDPDCAAIDCEEIDDEVYRPKDQDYWVDPDRDGTASVAYCDFTTPGGPYGWWSKKNLEAYWSFDGTGPSTSTFGGYTSAWRSIGQSTNVPATAFDRSVSFSNAESTRMEINGKALILGSSFTVSAWFYLTSCYNNQIPLITLDRSYLGDHLNAARMYNAKTTGYFYNFGRYCTKTYNYTNWVHYAWVDDGKSFKVYRNGVALSPTSGYRYSGIGGQRLYYVGSAVGFGTDGFAGQLDDLAVWNRALSAAEIKNIRDQGKDGYPLRWK